MNERVLIVDDAADIREFLTDYILKPMDFEVIVATNGVMGLEMAIAHEPDLMIVDQQMPRLTGLEMLEKLRERGIQIPAILATAHGSEETAVKAFRLGVRDYVIKPFDSQDVINSIERALRESRLQNERDQLVQQLMDKNSELQRRAQELNVLYTIGKSVATSLDLEEVLHRVVEAAVYIIGAEEGTLMLLDEERGELYVRASKNLDEATESTRRPVTDSLAGKVLQTRRPIVVGADTQWTRTHTAMLVKSLIYVPLIAQEKPIGVIGVTNRIKNISFDSDDTRTLSALASYAAIAINNANIYSQISRERHLLRTSIDHTESAVLVLDTQYRVLLVNEAAQKLFDLTQPPEAGQSIKDLVKDKQLLMFLTQAQATDSESATFDNVNGRSLHVQASMIADGSKVIYFQTL